MNVKTLVFAFRGTKAAQVMALLSDKGLEEMTIKSSKQAVASFVDDLDLTRYQRILGLGLYTGPNKKQLRIETRATDDFRSNLVQKDHVELPNILEPEEHLTLSQAMGNSYCNLVAFSLTQRIANERSKTTFSFVHVPSSFSVELAANVLNRQLVATSTLGA